MITGEVYLLLIFVDFYFYVVCSFSTTCTRLVGLAQLGRVKKLIITYLLFEIGGLPACTKLKDVGKNAMRPSSRGDWRTRKEGKEKRERDRRWKTGEGIRTQSHEARN